MVMKEMFNEQEWGAKFSPSSRSINFCRLKCSVWWKGLAKDSREIQIYGDMLLLSNIMHVDCKEAICPLH